MLSIVRSLFSQVLYLDTKRVSVAFSVLERFIMGLTGTSNFHPSSMNLIVPLTTAITPEGPSVREACFLPVLSTSNISSIRRADSRTTNILSLTVKSRICRRGRLSQCSLYRVSATRRSYFATDSVSLNYSRQRHLESASRALNAIVSFCCNSSESESQITYRPVEQYNVQM